MTLADLIGIPWKVRGRSLTGIDCVGLATMAQELFHGREINFPQDYDEGNYLNQSEIILHEVLRLFEPTDKPKQGDIGLFFFQNCWHVVTFTDTNHFLHIFEGKTSRISRLTPAYMRFLKGVYKWRER